MIKVSIKIKATPDTIWKVLLDKMEYPERYIPGIEDCEIMERSDAEFLRKIYTKNNEVTELFVANEADKTLRSTLVKHPFFSGALLRKIEADPEGGMLTMEQNWTPKSPEAAQLDLESLLKESLQQLKEFAEEDEGKSA